MARTHLYQSSRRTPGPIRREISFATVADTFCIKQGWGLWIPAFAGTTGAYRPVFHALVSSPISALTASRIADGVREKRGAGAGWVTP